MKKDSDIKFYLWVIVILAIAGIVIYSVKYIKPGPKGYESYTYNGFTILNMSGTYYTSIKIPDRESAHNIEMRYPPDAVDDIPMEKGIVERIKRAKGLYLTTRPDLTSKTVIAMVEVGKIVGDRYDILNIPSVVALTAKTETTEADRVIASCSNATADVPVIFFNTGDSTIIYHDDGCIHVQGKTEDDIIKASDKLGYALMGIIKID